MKNKKQKTKKELDIREKAIKYMEMTNKIARSLGISVLPFVIFPKPKSFYAKLARFFLRRSKAVIDTQFSNINK